MEIANGFSGINDPAEQERRFWRRWHTVETKCRSSSMWITFARFAMAPADCGRRHWN